MSTQLETQVTHNDAAEAAFLIPTNERQVTAETFSSDFSTRYPDLLHDGAGLVLQSGLDALGHPVEMDDPQKNTNVTLYFDASQKGTYEWHLVTAHSTARREYHLAVTGPTITASKSLFDAQGRAVTCNEQGDPADASDFADPEELEAFIRKLAAGDMVRQHAAKIRSGRTALEHELARFTQEKILKLSPDLYKTEVEKKLDRIEKVGFMALKPSGLRPDAAAL